MSQPAPLNTRYTLHLLSTKTSDSSPSLLVTFDDSRYLFNVPESISRICLQNKVAMKKIGKVFTSELKESGGLPGFILSTFEAGNRELEIVGPEGLDHLVASYRFFTRRDLLSLKLTVPSIPSSPVTCLPPPIHSDPNLIVYAFPVTATTPSSPTLKRKRSLGSPSPPPRSHSPPAVRSRSPSPSLVTTSSITTLSTEATVITTTTTTTTTTVDTSIHDFDTSLPDFVPFNFKGERATAWREAVLSDMFKGTAFVSPSSTSPAASTSTLPLPPPPEEKDVMALYLQSRIAPGASYVSKSLPSYSPGAPRTVISYLAVGPPLRGKFLPHEAIKRGVRPGQDFSKLSRGESVWVPVPVEKVPVEKVKEVKLDEVEMEVEGKGNEKGKGKEVKLSKKDLAKARQEEEKERLANALPDGVGEGTWVNPEDCMGEGSTANAFLVFNIPSIDFVPSLAAFPTTIFTTLPQDASLKTAIHFLGPGVLKSPSYSTFLKSFPSTVTHRITSPDLPNSNPVTFAPAALLSLRLSKMDQEIFNLPQYTYNESLDQTTSFPKTFPAETSRMYTNDLLARAYEPTIYGPDIRTFDFVVPSTEADVQAGKLKSLRCTPALQAVSAENYAKYLEKAKVAVEDVRLESLARDERNTVAVIGDDLKVTPLGTGSATPSKYRNVSGTLLHLPEGGYILLDAGEGTWGQIARRFGEEEADNVLRELKVIFISHMHADHQAGLTTIMKRRNLLSPKPKDDLYIIAPSGVRIYLYEVQQLFDIGLWTGRGVRFIDSWAIESGRPNRMQILTPLLEKLSNITDILPVPVLHRCRAWGLVIEHKLGWKVVFSGDTMPCDALVRAGEGATLLIHEATIEDELPEVAKAKGHSTFGQAIDIARRMKATYCLLTHFSARYPKLPPLARASSTPSEQHEPIVAMAFDLATLRLGDFWKMEMYRDAMDVLFDGPEEDDESVVGDKVEIVVEKDGKKKKKDKKSIPKVESMVVE